MKLFSKFNKLSLRPTYFQGYYQGYLPKYVKDFQNPSDKRTETTLDKEIFLKKYYYNKIKK